MWYYTGVPCRNGHICERNATNGRCRECIRGYWARRSAEQKRQIGRRQTHTLAGVVSSRVARARNRAKKVGQLCTCCKPGDFRAIYRKAQLQGGVVDHIVPYRQGGLHCAKNLQVMSPEAHREKTRTEWQS